MAVSSSAISSESSLSKIFTSDMIGANVAYFERISGPARNTSLQNGLTYNIYKIEGCEVTSIIKGGTVTSIGINKLSKKCTFNLLNIIPNIGDKRPILAHEISFGFIYENLGGGKYGATCLIACGNAEAPSVYLDVNTPRVYGGYYISASLALLETQAINASIKWSDAMKKTEGEDWIISTKFNETLKYNSIAAQAFKNLKITSISIGIN